MNRLSWLGCLGVLFTVPAFAQSHMLAEAERAYQGVDFPATHVLSQRALEAGGASREETARLYVLLGISAAAQGNVDEAKQDFVVALAVDPSFKLDKGLSPKIRDPYLEAQGYWAASSERLALHAKPASDAHHLIVRLLDSASLVTQVELRIGAPGVLPRSVFALQAAPVTRFALPAPQRERGYEYVVRALDRYGNVLSEQGTDADPQIVRAPSRTHDESSPPAAAHGRSYFLPITLGIAGLGAAAAGVVFHVKREHAARDWNGPSCENPGQTRIEQCKSVDSDRQTDERLAIGFYAAGGALLTGSIISLIAGRPSEAAPPRAGLLGCAVTGTGVSCDGHF